MRTLGALAVVLLATGCYPKLGETPVRDRDVRPFRYPENSEQVCIGCIWAPDRGGWYSDQRARRQGDLVTVVIQENADASRNANTQLERQSSESNTVSDVLGRLKLLKPELAGAQMLGGKSNGDFKGGGNSSRSERLTARLQCRVKQVLPNGDLFIEGYKRILVNNEEQELYASGLIRAVDIADDNTIASWKMAEAEIAFDGRGVLSDENRPSYIRWVLRKANLF